MPKTNKLRTSIYRSIISPQIDEDLSDYNGRVHLLAMAGREVGGGIRVGVPGEGRGKGILGVEDGGVRGVWYGMGVEVWGGVKILLLLLLLEGGVGVRGRGLLRISLIILVYSIIHRLLVFNLVFYIIQWNISCLLKLVFHFM